MDTSKVIEEVRNILWRAEELYKLIEEPYFKENRDILDGNLKKITASSSGSWIGYHAHVYYKGFRTPAPGDHFSIEWGLRMPYAFQKNTSENWREYTRENVDAVACENVAPDFRQRLTDASRQTSLAYNELRFSLQAVLNILSEASRTHRVAGYLEELNALESWYTSASLLEQWKPRGATSRDSMAVYQGIKVPPHIEWTAWLKAMQSPFWALLNLTYLARKVLKYLELRETTMPESIAVQGSRVFIGHGRSLLWRELKDLIVERLKLPWEEFNRESVAGVSTVERLQEMLASSGFALLVMTAEDEHADQTHHARENVIHEVGLFQGRLGFRKAIVLLEEGCAEFSNIIGLSQIRFPKGRIAACFEEVRRVLEREGMVAS
jgi:hypothetical protein